MSSSEVSDASSDSDTSSASQAPHVKNKIEESSSDTDDGPNLKAHNSDSVSDEEDQDEDDPVLSHAEKRRQKKKERKPTSETKEKQNDKEHKVKNTATIHDKSKLPKRQNSVWVGNLSFKATPDSLKCFFDGVGEITRVHMPMKMASTKGGGAVKENRGFAYVDFATPEAKVIAITLSENPLDGRRLLIKDGDDFNGRPSTSTAAPDSASNVDTARGNLPGTGTTKTARKILSSQKQPAGPTLFLGNLSFEATDQSIRDMLERNSGSPKSKKRKGDPGDSGSDDDDDASAANSTKTAGIRKIRMGTFEDSGKCKGWAFVDFISVETSTAALTNPRNHRLDGRELVVEFASPDAVRRGGVRLPGDKPGGRRGPGKRPVNEDGFTPSKRKDVSTSHDGEPHVAEQDESPKKKRRTDGEGEQSGSARFDRTKGKHGTTPKTRPKPGAALALAKRQDPAILPSQGQKIVF